MPLRLARLRSLVGGAAGGENNARGWSLALGRVRMFGRRGAGELRRVEIAGPAGQLVRDGERSDS